MNFSFSRFINRQPATGNWKLGTCYRQLRIQLLTFKSKFIKLNIQLRNEFHQGIHPSFCVKEFIQHNDPSRFEQTPAALESAALVAYNIFRFTKDIF